ncbi:MAG: putative baseplate assembly protein [Myxococcales bacterium]|nr:putative baseplate assembly protein [Myxococcota bacterium]MDW8282661.1 putative baseplate assembly protein [Myxococcales bacterium]
MIPTPKLDDRTYADIIAEAIRLIPRYSPEWTNHNPSDPGITILELCAWMTELILYRLNQVPEKNYLAFLNMLGIKLQPAQPARALITFELTEGAERQVLRAGMQVSTQQSDDEEAVIFETTRDLVVISARVDRCFSYFDETYSDHSAYFVPIQEGKDGIQDPFPPEGFLAFAGAERVDRFIYLGDDRLVTLSESAVLRLHVSAPEHGGRDLARLLEWEYWNGRRWRELKLAPHEVERGEVIFLGPSDMQPCVVNGIESYFIRGRLAEVPRNAAETEVDTVKATIEVLSEEGLVPDQAFANLDNNLFISLDLGKNIHPFGTEPKIDHCLYIASQEALSAEGAEVEIDFKLSDPQVAPPPQPSDDLVLSWEYFDGKKWRILGKATPRGKAPPGFENLGHEFVDGTHAFTRSGVVRFRRPKNLSPGEVSGEPNYWVRVRLELGDYGVNGVYMLDGDRWVWKDERPLRPPAFKSIGIRYRTELGHLKYFLSYNDFRWRDHSEEEKNEYRPFQPFQAIPDQSAAIYFGWNGRLPNDLISLFIQVVEGPMPEQDRAHAEHLARYYASRAELWEPEQRVVWEYFNGSNWVQLHVNDGTKNLTTSGFVEFVGPDDMEKTLKFTEDRYWVRARLEMGGYIKPPRIRRVLQNTVEATNSRTIYNEILGSSDGTPLQTFTLLHGPLLENEILEVREREMPKEEELEELRQLWGDAAVRPDPEEGGYWVRWKPVESFFESGPRSRHYILDHLTRTVHFGDDVHGMVPPQGRNNVVARLYRVGGGTKGNVNAFTLNTLTRAVAYIEKCYNVLPAVGGADAETVEEAKVRAPRQIKTRFRAVTAEDFETLALASTTSIARAKCLPSDEHNGHVQLVIVPRGDDKGQDLTRKLIPPPELCRFVKRYLDDRRLITTIVDVTKPSYVDLSIKVTLIRRTVGQSERLRTEVEQRLRRYLHPLVGGKDGKGWPFGRPIFRSDLVHVVEDIPGVEAIDSIAIYDEDRRIMVDSVRLKGDELPHVLHVAVIERVRQEMI